MLMLIVLREGGEIFVWTDRAKEGGGDAVGCSSDAAGVWLCLHCSSVHQASERDHCHNPTDSLMHGLTHSPPPLLPLPLLLLPPLLLLLLCLSHTHHTHHNCQAGRSLGLSRSSTAS